MSLQEVLHPELVDTRIRLEHGEDCCHHMWLMKIQLLNDVVLRRCYGHLVLLVSQANPLEHHCSHSSGWTELSS